MVRGFERLLHLEAVVDQAQVESKHKEIEAALGTMRDEPSFKVSLIHYERIAHFEKDGDTSRFKAIMLIPPSEDGDTFTQQQKMEMLAGMPNTQLHITNGQLGAQLEVEIQGLFKVGNSKQ
ncbi:MAG TPA: hypothetical protein VFG51_03575 [Candidatus Saccharimonadia bacterium]|nr:hypothetical protein [Candidatus Saccharimonadia bacterium]